MIRKIAWDTFKNTGNINTFLEYKQIKNIEDNLANNNNLDNMQKAEQNGDSKNQWNNNF